jgi:hypothetical protein
MSLIQTTAADAIAYIKANPNLTTDQLIGIADRMSASSGAAKVKITYSGGIRKGGGVTVPAFQHNNQKGV